MIQPYCSRIFVRSSQNSSLITVPSDVMTLSAPTMSVVPFMTRVRISRMLRGVTRSWTVSDIATAYGTPT